MCLWLLTTICLFFELSKTSGYLYPYETESRETRSLDGLWDFKICPENKADLGFTDGWHSKNFKELGDSMKMPVPSSFNDITTNKTIRDYLGWAWYQRTFFVPSRWLSDDIRVFVHFGGVHYLAVIYLNGIQIGRHEGGHLPFQLELPLSVLKKLNSLVVAVNNTLTLNTIPQGELCYPNDTRRYPPGYKLYSHDFDYVDYAGINRPVMLFTTSKVYVSGINITTDINKGAGYVTYSILTSDAATCLVKLFDKSLLLVAQSLGCRGNLTVTNAHLWWPALTCNETPGYLYSMQVTLNADSTDGDVYTMPVGIRTVRWTNTSLLVNNKPVYLRGFGMHEDANIRGRGFDYAVLSRDLSLIRWVAANAIRTSHYPYAEETLNQADALGIMVIVEAPACSLKNFGDKLYQRHKAYLMEMMNVHRNRPGVIMWSMANEPVSNTKTADYYFGNLSLVAKRIDSTRPVTFVGSVPILNETAARHNDIICINRYFSWYSDSGHTDLITYQMANEVKAWHRKFNRPVLVTEYGADSYPGVHTLPDSMWSEEYQAEVHRKHFEAFDKLRQSGDLAGELMWNFIDFNTPQEYFRPGRCFKGLFTRERQPKQAAYVLRSRHQTLAKCP